MFLVVLKTSREFLIYLLLHIFHTRVDKCIQNLNTASVILVSIQAAKARSRVYLAAVQVQTLLPHLQLQHLHLVVPLLLDGRVPHDAPVQRGLSPAHDLGVGINNRTGLTALPAGKTAAIREPDKRLSLARALSLHVYPGSRVR